MPNAVLEVATRQKFSPARMDFGADYTAKSSPSRNPRIRYIWKHFNGRNLKELCSLLDVSERFVYEVMGEAKGEGQGLKGQEGLW